MVESFTGEIVREKINQNNLIMQSLFNPSQFTLSEEIIKLQEENAYLQSVCPHEFENGVCIYCNKGE